MITGKLYNWLKFIALVALPGVGTLYVALAALWGLPSPESVSGTILAVDTFLGAILHISSSSYNSSTAQGTLNVHATAAGGKLFDLQLDGDPEEAIEGKERVVFRVRKVHNSTIPKPAAPRARRKKGVSS